MMLPLQWQRTRTRTRGRRRRLLAVGTGLRFPCRASCGRSSPLVCTRMPQGRLSIAWRAENRVEWLALSGLRYLTNWTNSRVRSSDLFHTKSPFSRFFGCRRQKSENIVVSARGRRTSQAPTLRISGCANARKYDCKLSSLYSQSRSEEGHHISGRSKLRIIMAYFTI